MTSLFNTGKDEYCDLLRCCPDGAFSFELHGPIFHACLHLLQYELEEVNCYLPKNIVSIQCIFLNELHLMKI